MTDNGEKTTPDEDDQDHPSPLRDAREAGQQLVRRYRRQLLPLAVIGATHVLGATAAAVAGFWALLPLTIGIVGAVGGYSLAYQRTARDGRIYAGLSAASSAAWQSMAAVLGPGGWMTWTLWLGGYTLAVPYWVRNSEPDPDVTAEKETPSAAPPAPPTDQPDWRPVRWGSYIGKSNGHLPGSRLSGITDIAYGWRATVELHRGQHWHEVFGRLSQIASVFDLPDGRVMVERIEGAPVHRARLTVLTSNPLEQVTYWPGPGLDRRAGTFPIAVTADGATLPLRLWWPGAGTCHTLISGTTGSGKSACLNIILSEIAASDRLYPVLIDGNGGMSVPDWLEHVPQQATTFEGALAQLEWTAQVMDIRAADLARIQWTDRQGRSRRGVNSIDPSPELPGIVVIFDEAQNPLKDQQWGKRYRALLEKLAQMGRKTAISVVLVTQQPSVTELGGSSLLRNMLKSGNVIAFRTADRVAGGMVVDTPLPEQLHQLPQQWPDGSPTQGLCYVLTQRAIRARTWLNPDPYAYAELMPGKRLDAQAASIPAPPSAAAGGSGSGEAGAGCPGVKPSVYVATRNDVDATEQVRAAVQAGTPADPAAVMQATGLSLRQAKRALSQLN